jgi:hypothetical protein
MDNSCKMEDYRYDIDAVVAKIIETGPMTGCRSCDYKPQFIINAEEEHRKAKKIAEKDLRALRKRQIEKRKKEEKEIAGAPLVPTLDDISISDEESRITIRVSDRLQHEFRIRRIPNLQRHAIIAELYDKKIREIGTSIDIIDEVTVEPVEVFDVELSVVWKDEDEDPDEVEWI